jgi:diguanylate cyclase (GGDEF)-like protein
MTARRTGLFLALTTLAVAGAVVTYGSDGGNVLYVGTYLVVCGLGWRATRLAPAGARLPWALIAAAITLWLGGDLVELVHFYLGSVPAVGLGDVFWLSGYPLVAVALTLMARRRAPGRMRAAVLDTLTLTVAAGAAAWQFLIEPLLQSGYGVATSLVPALYPVGDVVLLAGALFIALSPGTRTAPTRMLLAAAGVYLGMDLGYNLLPYVLDWSLVDRLGPLVILGSALLVAAGLHPGRAELTHAGHRSTVLHPARVVFLGLALMTAPLLAMLQSGFSSSGIVLIVATLGCAAFVLARFTTAVREQERFQAQLAFQARHDALTGLANRAELGDRLHRLPPGRVSVLYLDLDGFKQVNDQHGHEAGDAVLQVVSRRLSAAVRETDLVARLGGDEFVILCPAASPAEVTALADRVAQDLTRPIAWQGLTLRVGVSVGVATDADGAAPSDLLRQADQAMYQAKRQGRASASAERAPAA